MQPFKKFLHAKVIPTFVPKCVILWIRGTLVSQCYLLTVCLWYCCKPPVQLVTLMSAVLCKRSGGVMVFVCWRQEAPRTCMRLISNILGHLLLACVYLSMTQVCASLSWEQASLPIKRRVASKWISENREYVCQWLQEWCAICGAGVGLQGMFGVSSWWEQNVSVCVSGTSSSDFRKQM